MGKVAFMAEAVKSWQMKGVGLPPAVIRSPNNVESLVNMLFE